MLIPSSILQAIHGHCLVNFGDTLYIIGGTTDSGASNELYTLECGANSTWTKSVISLTTARTNHACSVLKTANDEEIIMVVGGIAVDGTLLDSTEFLSIGDDGTTLSITEGKVQVF